MDNSYYSIWQAHNTPPFHFPMDEKIWLNSMSEDVDSDGRKLFSCLLTESKNSGLIQYGSTAFGFDASGELSSNVHHNVIRLLCFDPSKAEDGEFLLHKAMSHFGAHDRIYAFFHYFGMSACARHGKLHEKDTHVEALLKANGFVVEHENVYYSKTLTEPRSIEDQLTLSWKPLSSGNCREFAAAARDQEIGWGQVHFLPQGNIAYLRWIYIDEKHQHQGYGSAIMEALFSQLYCMDVHRFDTDTALDNTIAQRYYEKTGFSRMGITRSYYK